MFFDQEKILELLIGFRFVCSNFTVYVLKYCKISQICMIFFFLHLQSYQSTSDSVRVVAIDLYVTELSRLNGSSITWRPAKENAWEVRLISLVVKTEAFSHFF
jgi:hypothetical protein